MKESQSKGQIAIPSSECVADLRARLEDAESTIEAIRSGAIDAVIVSGGSGPKVYTLEGADEPYRIFVEKMNEGAVTLDGAGTILYCNRAFSEMLREPLERVIGTSFGSYIPGDMSFDVEQISRTGNGRSELVVISQEEKRPVLCSVTKISVEGPSAFAVTVTDLTQQKQHEDELQRAVAELEGFCYTVSHDLRAPLRSMVSAAHILIEDYSDCLPGEAQKELQRIAASANFWGRLIDDLLAYSRLLREEIVPTPVDLSKLANQVANSFERGDRALIDWEIEPNLMTNGDARLLGMALHNLFSNAIKFTAMSDPAVIRFGFDTEKKAFYVTDNGIGFDMQYVHKLFVPFERLHRQAEYPGTGIGLANVKTVIERHNGNVWVQSAPNEGATFYFTIGIRS